MGKSRMFLGIGVGSIVAIASIASAVPPSSGDPDLQATSMTFKTKCNTTTCTVKNLTVLITNNGTGDASNASLDYYLSDDSTLTTETDTFVHRVALGKVKAGKTRKRTLGGGLLKQHDAGSGDYVFVVIDADGVTSETNENNNTFGAPIPFPAP